MGVKTMRLEESGVTTDSYKLQQPEHIVSLATSSMLVSVDINVWTATKQDRGISDEVATMKKAELGTAKVTKYLFARNPKHNRIVKLRQLIRKWLVGSTYRWSNSQHLLPTVDLERFKQDYEKYEREFNTAVEDFLSHYKNLVSDEAFKQGDMFDKNDYPSIEELRQKFNMRLFVAEVPSHDFRCQVSQDTADDLKAEYQQQADEIVKTVLATQVNRIVDVMKSISHCCGHIESVDKEGKPSFKRRAIYDTTFQRAKALVNTIKNFKPMNNEQSDKLQNAVDDLEKVIGGVSADVLRDSDSARAEVKQGIDKILSKFD